MVIGTCCDPAVKDTQTLVSPQHARDLKTGRRRGMFQIIFAGGGHVKKCIGGSSGVGFCQSRNAELSHSGTATSPDFEARVVLSGLVTTPAVCVIFQRSLEKKRLVPFSLGSTIARSGSVHLDSHCKVA